MLSTGEAYAAMDALVHPGGGDKAGLRSRLDAYYVERGRIVEEFAAWLANKYASDLPATVQDRIWSKAWQKGNSAGYAEVENEYLDFAEFAQGIEKEILESIADIER